MRFGARATGSKKGDDAEIPDYQAIYDELQAMDPDERAEAMKSMGADREIAGYFEWKLAEMEKAFKKPKVKERQHDVSNLIQRHMMPPVDKAMYLDCQAFGAGCCCVQATFSCRNLEEATKLYDFFLVLGPILLALTAATPCVRGRLVDTDTRWDMMSQTWVGGHWGFVVGGVRKVTMFIRSSSQSGHNVKMIPCPQFDFTVVV